MAKKIKQKKCAYSECGKMFTPMFSTVQMVCSPKCAVMYNSEKEIKKRVESIKIENMEVFKERLQTKIQEISRLIDKGMPCLATKAIPKQMHGGHVFARGGNSYMAMNLHNIHRQSAQSNHFQNDDGLMKEGLKNEYGEDYLEFVSNLRRTPNPNLNNMEYASIYKKAYKVANKLIKLNQEYSLKKRIELRNEVNLELGIYDKEYCVFNLM
jgi:hypothetical protein